MTARPGAWAIPLLILGGLAGCGGSPAPSPAAAPASPAPAGPAPAPAPAPPPAPPVVAAIPTPDPTSRPVASALPAVPPPRAVPYSSKGRRDPFETLEVREGSASTTLSSARLTGIIRGTGQPLALVETADGLGYILRPGDTLGDGRVVEVGPDRVVFQTRTGSTSNRVVLRLPGD